MKFFATSSDKCSFLLEKECISLGLKNIKIKKGGVSFEGSFKDGERFCLYTFYATRLLVQIKQKEKVENIDDIYSYSKSIKWEEWISDTSKTFLVTQNTEDTFWCKNSLSASLKVKDAICDRQREIFTQRSNVDKDNPDIVFHMYLSNSEIILYADFSSRSLSKRHYRVSSPYVYLQESISSALLSFSPYTTLLEKGKNVCVVDPFCGSGTILIEAALKATGSIPGLIDTTRYGFLKFKDFNDDEWRKLLEETINIDKQNKERFKNLHKNEKLFIGYDIDEKVLEIAKESAKKANVEEFISFVNKDCLTLTTEDIPQNSCIITDPPYSRRIEVENINVLYYKFSKKIQEITDGGTITILTGDEKLLDFISYPDKRVFKFQNGALRVYVVNKKFLSLSDKKLLEEQEELKQQELLNSPLKEGSKELCELLLHRKKEYDSYFLSKNVTSYRLYDRGVIPFNLSIDIFENKYAVIYDYSQNREDNKSNSVIKDDVSVVLMRLGFLKENIYFKERKVMDRKTQYEKNENLLNQKFIIHEHKLNFLVDFSSYIDNGIFLDSRLLRDKIMKCAKNKRFLNLFCYTGTATLHAIKGGALSTVSVDSSNTYISWFKENLRINNCEAMNNIAVTDDCFSYLKSLNRETKFDLVFCDPPTFSNSHSRRSFDIAKDHEGLINIIMSHLSDNGLLIFCTNFRDFKMSETIINKYSVKETTGESIDIDFKDRKHLIHKSYEIRKKLEN